jgi:hypothetical protein
MNQKPPSQNAIGRALGLSSSNMTKLRKQGCPMDTVESVRAWRLERQNIAQRKPEPQRLQSVQQGSAQVSSARVLMEAAGSMVEAGQAIDSMLPALRAALAVVPQHERDDVGLDLRVMKLLLRPVLDAIPSPDEHPVTEEGAPVYADGALSDSDAKEAGQFWYQVAAGELLIDVGAVRQMFGLAHGCHGSLPATPGADSSRRVFGLLRGAPKGVVW